jgi:hypothetical protein
MRLVAGAMTFAVAAVVSASCLAAENMTPAQRACCAAMEHDCGEMKISAGCCGGQTQDADSLTAMAKVDVAASLAPSVIVTLDGPEPVGSVASMVRTASSTPVKPPGTSTYLVVSSFRL